MLTAYILEDTEAKVVIALFIHLQKDIILFKIFFIILEMV